MSRRACAAAGAAARGWAGEILALRNSGAYPLELTAPAPLRLAPGRVELGRLDAKLGDGRSWSATPHGPAPRALARAARLPGLPAEWLIVATGLSERVCVHAADRRRLAGGASASDPSQLEGVIHLKRAAGDLAPRRPRRRDRARAHRAALEARFAGGRTTASAEIVARAARVVLQGQVDAGARRAGQGRVRRAAHARASAGRGGAHRRPAQRRAARHRHAEGAGDPRHAERAKRWAFELPHVRRRAERRHAQSGARRRPAAARVLLGARRGRPLHRERHAAARYCRHRDHRVERGKARAARPPGHAPGGVRRGRS